MSTSPYTPRPRSAWLVMLALLLNALLPSMAMLGTPPPTVGQAGWVEICAAQGRAWLRLSHQGQVLEKRQSPPAELPAAGHGSACAYCPLDQPLLALLPPAVLGAMLWPLHHQVRMRDPRNVWGRFHWCSAAARAPPSFPLCAALTASSSLSAMALLRG